MFSEVQAALDGANAVLITHEHPDHIDVERCAVAPAAIRGCSLGAGPGRRPIADLGEQVVTVEPRRAFEAGRLPGAHVRRPARADPPDDPGLANVGYLVEESVYHPGDSLIVPPVPVVAAPRAGPRAVVEGLRGHRLRRLRAGARAPSASTTPCSPTPAAASSRAPDPHRRRARREPYGVRPGTCAEDPSTRARGARVAHPPPDHRRAQRSRLGDARALRLRPRRLPAGRRADEDADRPAAAARGRRRRAVLVGVRAGQRSAAPRSPRRSSRSTSCCGWSRATRIDLALALTADDVDRRSSTGGSRR